MIYSHLPQRSGRSIAANTNNPPQDPPQATTLPPTIEEKPIAPISDIIIAKISVLENKIAVFEEKITVLEKKITALEQKKIVIPDITILEKKITILEQKKLVIPEIQILKKKITVLENSKQESKITKEIPKKSLFRKFLTKIFGRK